ncbi:MAG: hypothetical protein AAGA48_38915, partial [Myxococcota bacterium]
MTARFGSLLALVALAACGPKNVRDIVGQPIADHAARIAVAEPMFLNARLQQQEEGPKTDMDVWRSNTWVGRIWFGGGYDLIPEEGDQIRSIDVTLDENEAFTEQVRQWVKDVSPVILADAGYELASPVGEVQFSTPERREQRGTIEFDGKDNVNLPRFDLVPGPPISPGVKTDADAIFVPVVVSYYAHNAGWFIGQEDGSWGGARLRLYWSLVAPDDGQVLGWGEVGTRIDEMRLASPNRQQQQDLLLTVEAEAAE